MESPTIEEELIADAKSMIAQIEAWEAEDQQQEAKRKKVKDEQSRSD